MGFHDLSEPGMNYWSSTDEVLAQHGGEMPTCFICKQRMYPIDDLPWRTSLRGRPRKVRKEGDIQCR